MSLADYSSQISQAASSSGTPAPIIQWVLEHEDSTGDPTAVNSTSGATGIGQFLPSTAADPGYGIAAFDPDDPDASINATGEYLQALYQKTGSWSQAVQDYGTTANSPGLQGDFEGFLASNGITDQGFGAASVSNAVDTVASDVTGTGATGRFGMMAQRYTQAEAGKLNSAGYTPGTPTTTLSGYLTEVFTRGALILLGLICLIGGFVLLGERAGTKAISSIGSGGGSPRSGKPNFRPARVAAAAATTAEAAL